MTYLVGDIGGTRVRLRLIDRVDAEWHTLHEQRSLSADSASAFAAIQQFLDALAPPLRESVRGACLAVAGPVANGRATMTNLPWQFGEAELAKTLVIEFVELINDFAAVAMALPTLPEQDLQVIHPGRNADGLCIAIGPGTGLGQVMFRRRDDDIEYFPSEGGHLAFAPLDEEQDRLLDFLRAQHGRVSYEHVLSGRGLTALYRYACARRGLLPDAMATTDDAAARVTQATFAGDVAAIAAVEMFWAVLGAFAGDAVLSYVARGGVYLTGGILPHLPPGLGREAFCRAFENKAAMTALVADVPVHLVTRDDVGLIGAQARIVRRLSGRET
jgi:glucokinase